MRLSGFLAEERCVRLTIFWRVIFAQLTLIALILGMGLYALLQLHHLASLSITILTIDSTSIEAEKRLLKIFLSQMRIAEKYLVVPDKGLYSHFVGGSSTFTSAVVANNPWIRPNSPPSSHPLRPMARNTR